MLRTMEWLQENPQTSLICTDSLSLHSALSDNNWKDKDPWLKEIKKILFNLSHSTTILWVPSHCGIPGNGRADELAKAGSELPQDGIPVIHQIIKAKIKSRRWPLFHTRAISAYSGVRTPDSQLSRLRTGHAKERKSYQHRLGLE